MAETWLRLRQLFEGSVELDGADRVAYLDRACADEPPLRRAVERLLELDADEGPHGGSFLDRPVMGDLAAGVAGPASAYEGPAGAVLAGCAIQGGHGGQGDGSFGVGEVAIPERIGPYRVLKPIGRGGLGVVVLAIRDDGVFERRVAIKLVRRDFETADLVRRLETERQILAGLRHPNIAELYDGGTTPDGRPYVVMEYVEGLPIDRYCDQHRLRLDERIELFEKVCVAVAHAHRNLIVHRDLKPANILISAEGEPKLLDFGIAKLLNPELARLPLEPTLTCMRLLTPHYASPEQVRGEPVATASDVYSLGVLLYRLLTGRLPHSFEGSSPAEIERRLTEHDPPAPSTMVVAEPEGADAGSGGRGAADRGSCRELAHRRRADPPALARQLAGDLDAILLKTLRSRPQGRYSSVERLADDLRAFRQGRPVTARAGSRRYLLVKMLRRNCWAVALAASVLLVAPVAAGVVLSQAAEVARQRDRAELERQRQAATVDLLLDTLRVADPRVGLGEELTVREALERSSPRLRRRLADRPELLARALDTTGRVYANLGLWQRAERELEEASRLRGAFLDPLDHSESALPDGASPGDAARLAEAAATLSQLGFVRAQLGELDSGRRRTAGAVEMLDALGPEGGASAGTAEDAGVGGELGRRRVEALNNHVAVLCRAGEQEAADAPSRRALELARALPT
ncbi:MAG: serine/threonine protein kinase, partial [Holophagales bacterium]|nr:serine/threonine protein kinase [Holophagales bacterium]